MSNIRLPGIEALLRGQSVQPDCYHPPQEYLDQPRSRGWFDVNQPEVKRAIQLTRGLSRDDLLDIVFTLDDARPRYQRENLKSPGDILPNDTPKTKHGKCEKARRERHACWQETAHAMTPDLANQAIEHDATYLNGKHGGGRTKPTTKKAVDQSMKVSQPGKDEQLCSIIYTVALLAIAVQSEHDGRQQAEERAYQAEARLAALGDSFTHTSRKRRRSDDDAATVMPLPTKRRVTQPPLRLPPSPCPTACLSPSPTPTLSASSSFGY